MRLVATTPLSSTATVLCVASSGDHAPFAAATSDRAIHLIDSATLKPIHVLPAAHGDRINELTFAPASSLISASSDGTIKLWDAAAKSTSPVATLHAGRPGGGGGSLRFCSCVLLSLCCCRLF